MSALHRIFQWFGRFLLCVDKLGLVSALKVFLVGRFSQREMSVRLPDGRPFFFRGSVDRGVVSHFYKEGYFVDSGVDEIRTVLDIGANIGDETARFAYHYRHAEIVAVELSPINHALLEKNFESESRITTLNRAVWPTKSSGLRIVNPTSSMESFRAEVSEQGSGAEDVATITITDIIQDMGWDRIDILKLDIEGAEHRLFSRHFEDWIGRINVLIFEVPDDDSPGATQVIFRALSHSHHEFVSHICGENLVLIRKSLGWKLRKVIGWHRKSA